MHDSGDWFKFTTTGAGTADHFVRIDSSVQQGDLDLEVYNASGSRVGISETPTNSERVSLSGLAAGTYYVRAFGWDGSQNPNYLLEISPPGGGDPPPPPPPPPDDGSRLLYVNFEGATLSRGDLVFARTMKGLRNTVLLPAGYEVSAVSQPATIGIHEGRVFVSLINLNAENQYSVRIRARRAAASSDR